ncbi:MAG: hypothetical protein ACP5G7_08065, partial [Anaerolineae bacterium]
SRFLQRRWLGADASPAKAKSRAAGVLIILDAKAMLPDQVRFNRWVRQHQAPSDPPITLVDMEDRYVEQAATEVDGWIRSVLVAEGLG